MSIKNSLIMTILTDIVDYVDAITVIRLNDTTQYGNVA